MKYINLKGVKENNLKNINVKIPRGKITVLTGVSGSGKSTLAFDTIFVEGQRKYLESLSNYARQFIDRFKRPEVDYISGLSPTVSVDQKTFMRNPRSNVATITEIYDFLRLLYSRLGSINCHICKDKIEASSLDLIVSNIKKDFINKEIEIYYPLARGKKGEFKSEFADASKLFKTIRVNGTIHSLDEKFSLDRQKKHNIEVYVDSLKVNEKNIQRIYESIETALKYGEGLALIESEDTKKFFNQDLACHSCGISFPEISPRFFSFNSPYGQCKDCEGIGNFEVFDEDLIIPDKSKSIKEGAIAPFKDSSFYKKLIKKILADRKISDKVPFNKLTKQQQKLILLGDTGISVSGFIERYESTGEYFEGVMTLLDKWYLSSRADEVKDNLNKYRNVEKCTSCNGQKLRAEALSVRINDLNISEVCSLSVSECEKFLNTIEFKGSSNLIWNTIKNEIISRLIFLRNVSLDYLSLDRVAPTLSGGEAQRIRLASQLGANLTGITYVLDEPTIGLHPRDNKMLLDTLKLLNSRGNTVIIVEHDEETIRSADYIIDIGVGAGPNGGNIVAKGSLSSISKNKKSLTGMYLSRKKKIHINSSKEKTKDYLSIFGASLNNLKEINVDIPVGKITSVTGVSGSGKSSLVVKTIYENVSRVLSSRTRSILPNVAKILGADSFDKIININQGPIGRTSRSNPATYTGLFSTIREIFSSLPESKMKGFLPGRFSFNVKEGSCMHCSGAGSNKIEMSFLPDVHVKCDSCGGMRFDSETLNIFYRGKNIYDLLNMTFDEAEDFFSGFPILQAKVKVINSVGLGYIKLGQDATSLSGGEAQRIKLSKELIKKNTGKTLYIFDEPTIGLHYHDINKLLEVIFKLRDSGSTIIVIEHNMDIVNASDYIVDLGPEGGHKGGNLIFQGTKKDFLLNEQSVTAKYLRNHVKELN